LPRSRKILVQLLDARLVRDRWMRIRRARPRIGRIGTSLAVHVVQALGAPVIGLEVGVRDRPRRRRAAMMLEPIEVTLAQPEERRPIKLGVAANVVIRVRVERASVTIPPHVLRVVLGRHVHGARVPVVFLATHVIAALEDQNLLARGGEMVRKRPAASAAANDNYVVMHTSFARGSWPQKMHCTQGE
jgi:hypothetical protein